MSLFTPLINPTPASIIWMWAKYELIAVTSAILIFILLPKKEHEDFELNTAFVYSAVVVAPILEELIFRGLFIAWGMPLIGGVIWSILHLEKGLPGFTSTLITCSFYARLWMSGLWYLSIGFHALHNLLLCTILWFVLQVEEKQKTHPIFGG